MVPAGLSGKNFYYIIGVALFGLVVVDLILGNLLNLSAILGSELLTPEPLSTLSFFWGLFTTNCPNQGGPPGPPYSQGGYSGSTPFVQIQKNGKYEFENDFLFGKPNSVFANYELGLKAYTDKLFGGDTYLFKETLEVTSENNINLRVKEVEPEESYIDSVQLDYFDVPENHEIIVDADLETIHLVNTDAAVIPKQHILYHHSRGKYSNATDLVPDRVDGSPKTERMLASEDFLEIVIGFEELRDELNLIVDSYYRDWSLGSVVPFSFSERIVIGVENTLRAAPSVLTGIALALGVTGGVNKLIGEDKDFAAVNTARADTPYSQSSYYSQGSYRSLVVSVQVGEEIEHLQTIFPRYLNATKDLIKIPADFTAKARTAKSSLRVLIKATKKHAVKSAFIMSSGLVHESVITQSLVLKRATHNRATFGEVVDATALGAVDGKLTHTLPADTIDLTFEAPLAELKPGFERQYILKARGFYTALSDATRWRIGMSWYANDYEHKGHHSFAHHNYSFGGPVGLSVY
jgi:hypothetical protein